MTALHLGRRAHYSVLMLVLTAMGCASTIPKSVVAWRAGIKATKTVDGHTLRFIDVGPRDGEVILLLHGIPTNSSLYREVIPKLIARGYRLIVPDLLGYGASSKPKNPNDYAIDRQGQRILALLQELGIQKLNLVVHDLGGLVGWELLSAQPALVSRILVLNTTAYYEGFRPPPEMRMLAGPMGGMMSSMMGGGIMGRKLMGDFLKDNTGNSKQVDASIIDSVWWSMHEGSNVPMRAMATSFLTAAEAFPRYQRALRAFRGPSAILWGGRDKVLMFSIIGEMFVEDLRIPEDRQHVLAKAGHFLMLDDPEKTAGTILSLMEVPAHVENYVSEEESVAPTRIRRFSSPPPGPSVSAALDVADRGLIDAETHDLRASTRLRMLWGGAPAYAVGLDASAGYASGFAYRAAAYPLGIGYAGNGSQFSVVGGIGVHDSGTSGASLEAPLAVDIAWQLGPVRALAWGNLAWTREGFDALRWEGALGLRLGRSRTYFPNAFLGHGPYLAAIASGNGEVKSFGLALGVELGDGR